MVTEGPAYWPVVGYGPRSLLAFVPHLLEYLSHTLSPKPLAWVRIPCRLSCKTKSRLENGEEKGVEQQIWGTRAQPRGSVPVEQGEVRWQSGNRFK